MNPFGETLAEASRQHDAEVFHLRLAVSVLAFVPRYIEDFEKKLQHLQVVGDKEQVEALKQHIYVLQESLRIARLYAQESDLDGLSREEVGQRLSDGLA